MIVWLTRRFTSAKFCRSFQGQIVSQTGRYRVCPCQYSCICSISQLHIDCDSRRFCCLGCWLRMRLYYPLQHLKGPDGTIHAADRDRRWTSKLRCMSGMLYEPLISIHRHYKLPQSRLRPVSHDETWLSLPQSEM